MTLNFGRQLKRGRPLLRGTKLKQHGERSDGWRKFRNQQFQLDQNDERLIRCEDVKLGLPKCGISRLTMDLHHTKGRDGKLLYDRSKMVWLTRECHEIVHS